MTATYPIRFPAQLRQHLRALRKKKGLTQADVAALIGVSQARIAEIEANPGVVSVEQLMQFFSAIGATLILEESLATSPSQEPAAPANTVATPASGTRSATRAEHGVLTEALGLEHARKGAAAHSTVEDIRKILEPLGGLEQARKAFEANSAVRDVLKALEPLGGLEHARKALEANSTGKKLQKALEPLGGLEQARKMLEANSAVEKVMKALEPLGGLEQDRKALEAANGKGVGLSALRSYRDLIDHTKKGRW